MTVVIDAEGWGGGGEGQLSSQKSSVMREATFQTTPLEFGIKTMMMRRIAIIIIIISINRMVIF